MAKRLKKEAAELAESGLDWGSAEPLDDNLFHWTACIIGPEGTPYEGGVFNLDVQFPSSYPFKPPEVKFITKVYHPNVKKDSGEICADIIKEQWAPTLNMKWVLSVIKSLLEDPSGDSPLEPEIGHLLQTNKDEFVANAKKWTETYAT